MSLINDALKRATQTHQGSAPGATLNAPLQPVPSAPGSKLPYIIAGSLGILFIGAGLFFWQWANAKNKAHTPSSIAQKATPSLARPEATKAVATPSQTSTARPPIAQVAPATKTNPAPSQPALKPAVATPIPVSPATPASAKVSPSVAPPTAAAPMSPATLTPTSVPLTNVVTPSAPNPKPAPATVVAAQPRALLPGAFPDLRLKGIVYNATSPVAIINGTTLALGDEISGARLIKIERRKVMVRWNNQTKELLME